MILLIIKFLVIHNTYSQVTPNLTYRHGRDNSTGTQYLAPLDKNSTEYKHISHKLISRSSLDPNQYVEFGFNRKGGGYLWSAKLFGFRNFENGYQTAEPGYGKGLLGAIRDRYHLRAYNPEQAGRNDYQGVQVRTFNKTINGLDGVWVPQFQVGLYVDGSSGNSPPAHANKLPERSAFDFSSFTYNSYNYNVASSTHEEYWVFARYPKGIQSLNVDLRNKVKDISKSLSGDQTPTKNDLSMMIYTLRGIRPSSEFKYMYITRNGKLLPAIDISKLNKNLSFDCVYTKKSNFGFQRDDINNSTIKPIGNNPRFSTDFPLIIFSNSSDPTNGTSMAMYIPMDDNLNKNQTKGIKPNNGKVIFEEDRFIQMTFNISPQRDSLNSDNKYRFISARTFLSGLFSPKSATSFHRKPIREVVTSKSILLYGSPKDIYDSVK